MFDIDANVTNVDSSMKAKFEKLFSYVIALLDSSFGTNFEYSNENLREKIDWEMDVAGEFIGFASLATQSSIVQMSTNHETSPILLKFWLHQAARPQFERRLIETPLKVWHFFCV